MSKHINRKQLDELLLTTPDLNATARVILLAYASSMQFVDEVQETWQSDERICAYTGLSLDSVTGFRKALEEDGFLIVVRTKREKDNKSTTYRVLGKGTVSNKKLKRRTATDKQKANLIANAKDKKKKGLLPASGQSPENPSLDIVQKTSLDSIQKTSLDTVETNTNLEYQEEHQQSAAVAPDKTTDEPHKDDADPSLMTEGKETGGSAAKPSSSYRSKNRQQNTQSNKKEAVLDSVQTSLSINNVNAWEVAGEYEVKNKAMKYMREGWSTSNAVQQALRDKGVLV